VAIELDLTHALDFGAALLLGAMFGLERERRIADGDVGTAGLRSFVLVTQIGAAAGYLGQKLAMAWILPAAIVAVASLVIVGYLAALRARPQSVGLTTELAAICACVLGALATTGHRELAVALGVITAALLAYKESLHDAVARIPKDDVRGAMRLLLATFLVLPLLPNEPLLHDEPWRAVNLYKLWLLVLLISGMSFVGYVVSRLLGPGRGIVVTAITGGAVSSTAATLAFVKQSRENEGAARTLAAGILIAWTVMFVRVLITATVVNPQMLVPLLAPCLGMAAACVLVAFLGTRGAEKSAAPDVPVKNPFSLVSAGKFALLFGVVQLLVAFAQKYLPGTGTYVVAAVAGLTDVDAITLSMSEEARGDEEGGVGVAVIAIVIAAFSNTLVKTGIAIATGRGLARIVGLGAAAIVAAGIAALLLT
jgi:uncharacterized membrane protein (DUF4010 family)